LQAGFGHLTNFEKLDSGPKKKFYLLIFFPFHYFNLFDFKPILEIAGLVGNIANRSQAAFRNADSDPKHGQKLLLILPWREVRSRKGNEEGGGGAEEAVESWE
jgi:hypothetical protein